MNEIAETFVRVSVHPSMGFDADSHSFRGTGDMRAYQRLYHHDIMLINYTLRSDGDDANYRFFLRCYDLDDFSDPDNGPLHADMDQFLDRDDRARLWSLLHRMNKRITTAESSAFGNRPIAEEERRIHPPELIDLEALTTDNDAVPRGCYVDVFRRDPSGQVLLRTEQYCNAKGEWQTVSVRNLSMNRQPQQGTENEHFPIPADQTCYLVLSRAKLSPERLEQLRLRFQHNKPVAHAVTIPAQVTVRHYSRNGIPTPHVTPTDFRRRLIEIAEKRAAGEEIPSELYANIGELNHVLLDETGDLRVMLTDYKGTADRLRQTLNTLERDIALYIGDNTGTPGDRLTYLVSAAADAHRAWNFIDSGHSDILRERYADYQAHVGNRAWIASQLAWWVNQDGFHDTMYDYEFGADHDFTADTTPAEGMEDVRYYGGILLEGLAKIPTTAAPLEHLYTQARDWSRLALYNFNPVRDPETYRDINPETTRWNTAFTTRDAYDAATGRVDFWAEVLYPRERALTPKALTVIKEIAAAAVRVEGDDAEERIRGWLSYLLANLPGRHRLVVRQLEVEASVWSPELTLATAKAAVIVPASGRGATARRISNSSVHQSMKDVLVVVDLALAIRAAHKHDASFKEAVQLLKTGIDFAQLLRGEGSGRTSALAGQEISGQAISRYAWANSGALLDIVLGVIDIVNLGFKKGDWDAAIVSGGGSIVQAAVVLRYAALGIAVPTPVTIFLALFAIGTGLVAAAATDNEFETWLRHTTFGDRFPGESGGVERAVSGWPDFFRTYVAGDLADPETDPWDDAVIDTESDSAHWVQPDAQIMVYERLLYNVTIETATAYYYFEVDETAFTGYRFVEVVLEPRILLPDSRLTVALEDADGAILVPPQELDRNNAVLTSARGNGGNRITTYVCPASERPWLDDFLAHERGRTNDAEALTNRYLSHPFTFAEPRRMTTNRMEGYEGFPTVVLTVALALPKDDGTGYQEILRKRTRLGMRGINMTYNSRPLPA